MISEQTRQFLKRSLADAEGGRGKGLPRQVTICGGGNGAHVTAGYLGWKGIKVRFGLGRTVSRSVGRPIDWSFG